MSHTIEVVIKQPSEPKPLLSCRIHRIPAGLLRWVFGRERLVILVPGNSMDMVTVMDREGGAGDEQSKAAAGCCDGSVQLGKERIGISQRD